MKANVRSRQVAECPRVSCTRSRAASTQSTCLLAIGLLATIGPAGAVSVNPQGLGQVLLYPYYTVRSTSSGGAYSTLFTVTNTTADVKVIRFRARESRNGREVASVNVYLGSYDSWTGAISAGSQGAAVLATNDQSCVDPPLPGKPATLAFGNLHYSGPSADGEATSLDRTAEGYLEIFELGVVKDAAVAAAITVNPACGAAVRVPLDDASKIGPPTGGLTGNANVISVADGTLYAYEATALANFSSVPLWSVPSSPSPTLADVNPKLSRVFDDAGAHDATWDTAKGASPVDPVSAVLMASGLTNWFVLDIATQSSTDWVVTMPTKPYYADPVASGRPTARAPFETAFAAGGAPESFGEMTYDCNTDKNRTLDFDREGRNTASPTCFPEPPPSTKIALKWTASVMTVNQTGLFNAYAAANFPTPFEHGWLKLLPFQYASGPVHRLVSTDGTPITYYGLPMIGFMANDYVNRTLPVNGVNVLSNYSATSPHKYTRAP